jgi:hypothetical protein
MRRRRKRPRNMRSLVGRIPSCRSMEGIMDYPEVPVIKKADATSDELREPSLEGAGENLLKFLSY